MEKSSVFHISDSCCVFAIGKDMLGVRIRLKAGDCKKVLIYYKNLYDHTSPYFVTQMQPILRNALTVMYEAQIQVAERHFKYYFEIYTENEKLFYTADDFIDCMDETNCFYYPFINTDEISILPEWAQGGIIYQIFIDRFCRSADSIPIKQHQALSRKVYGGTFDGVMQKLEYIRSLGAEIIYLSPVFKSPTYHKYDITDYYEIDEAFGGREKLAELVAKSHEMGIRVILDAVFNHCSIQNALFQDVIRNGECSRYSKWFFIDSFPVDLNRCNYDTFAGCVPDMPRFDTANPQVIEYLTGVAVYWMKTLGIDGWRLDVADEVSHKMWREFRIRVKAVNPDALIIGEVWNQANRWLQGDEFDTVTNYKYRKSIFEFAKGKITSQEFWDQVSSNKMLYRTSFYPYLVNFTGSHDTVRCATALGDETTAMLVLAVTLTVDGMPLIYYGDEIAMQGYEDPDNRRAMRWDAVEGEWFERIRTLAQFRKFSDVLRRGSILPMESGKRVLAFIRCLGETNMTVVVNFGSDETEIAGRYSEMVLGEGEVTQNGVRVPGRRFAIVR